MPIQVQNIKLEVDYLWSIKLGASLRIMSVDMPYTYEYAIYTSTYRQLYTKIIPCAPGQLILCRPDVWGTSKFWTMEKTFVQKQIDEGKLIYNNIPNNWSELKRQANFEILKTT